MKNVLLVDDEPWVLEGLRTMVNWGDHGFQVCGEALNGLDALKLIQELQPELVVTDIKMPNLSGLELVEQSNRLLKRPPKFVILSGYDDFDYALTAIRNKVTDYLLKPIDEEEIEATLVRIGKKIGDELAAEQSLSRKQLLFMNNILNRLIQGEYNDDLELQAARSMDLRRDEELRCMLIDAGPNPGDLRQWVKTYFSQEIDRTFQDNSGRVGVILPTNDFPLARLEEIGLRIYRELMDSIDPSIIVTFSDSLTGIGSIRELYLHSLKIGNSKRSQGKTGVFYYTNHNHENHAIDIYKENVKELTDIFAAGDINRITVMVDKIINSFNEEWLDIGIAKAHMADLELSLCRRVAKMNGDPNSLMTSIQEKHGSLGGIVNYSILKRYLHDLCQDAASLLSQLTRQNENNTIFHVIQYVDREFQKKMQLQDLAKHFHMNATYLGQLFKKQTGKPFNEYVNEKRIKEAKKLLKHTQMKISEVALQVGYPNTDYFISKFKSSTGILPSVYKHELEKKKQTD